MQRRKVFPFEAAGVPRRAERRGTLTLLGRWGALLLVVAAAVGILAPPPVTAPNPTAHTWATFERVRHHLVTGLWRNNQNRVTPVYGW